MADAFDVTSSRQRRVVTAVLVVYVALLVVDLTTNVPWAGGVANLVLAALAVPGSLVVLERVVDAPGADETALAAAVAFLVAGLAIGYEGLAAFGVVPVIVAVELLGTVALLAALVLYFLDQR